jgi:signal transduction histidine kinase
VKQGLSDNVVTTIAQATQEETLWLGTNGGGLNRVPQASGQASIEAFPPHALPGTIYGILEDSSGRLWLSSRTGIFRVSLAPQLAAGTAGYSVAAYGTADGMNIRECSGGGHPAAWKLADGSLWFATLDGVSVIDPDHALENPLPPPVVIEKILVDDQARNLDQALTIKPGANRLDFQYAGLSFVAPQKVQYRYRLQGFDHGWIEAGSRRSAFYTNLPPGHYTFQVVAANNDGVWNTAGASFALRQLPHYYQTYWFYSALALACLLLGYLIYRWRVQEVEAQFGAVLAERGRLAREIHDTLAQGFVGVSVQLELVARLLAGSREAALKPISEHLDQARALVRASLAEARTSIWNLRSEGAAAEDLPSRLSQSCTRVSNGSSSKVYLQVKGTYRPVARKIEEELLRIGQEAVVNAVRHAAATRIDVQLIYEGTRVSLRVEDDGRGFEPPAGSSGPEGHYGIRGMHERAGEIDAALVLESIPGGGTRVSVEAPLA